MELTAGLGSVDDYIPVSYTHLEAKEADLGIAGGIGEGLLIKKGQIIRKIPEAEFIPTLRYELEHWNEQ